MTGVTLEFHTSQLVAALHLAPQRLAAELDRAISRSLLEMARTAKRNAPKAHSTLANTIHHQMLSSFEGEITAGVNYARYPEEGTPPQPLPPDQSILDWIKVKNIQPNDPTMTQADLAYVIARSIAARGTPPQPYAEPAFEEHKADTERRISEGILRALRMN